MHDLIWVFPGRRDRDRLVVRQELLRFSLAKDTQPYRRFLFPYCPLLCMNATVVLSYIAARSPLNHTPDVSVLCVKIFRKEGSKPHTSTFCTR